MPERGVLDVWASRVNAWASRHLSANDAKHLTRAHHVPFLFGKLVVESTRDVGHCLWKDAGMIADELSSPPLLAVWYYGFCHV